MSKRNIKYKVEWQQQYNWCRRSPAGEHSARCELCCKDFSIANSGVAQLKQHAETQGHKNIQLTRAAGTNQAVLTRERSGLVSLTAQQSINFTPEEQQLRSEILWALKCAKSNYSFASNAQNDDLFAKMFPDSAIAKNWCMGETKVKYILEYGIAEYVREKLIEDLNATPFTFMFDETTTSQVKKQYDGYVRYESKQHKRIVSHYAGSLFLGHCKAEAMKDHFFEFGHKLQWNIQNLIHIGMDGPNVNKLFHKLLEKELADTHGKKMLNIGTCSLHPVHTAFKKGLKELRFNFDELAFALHFFFKHSSARREDFALRELQTELEPAVMLRHVSSRWLSLTKV